MIVTIAEFFLILCLEVSCIENNNVIQIPMKPHGNSLNDGPEAMPKYYNGDKVYIIVPQVKT
jgi:putative transposon-encoded protein